MNGGLFNRDWTACPLTKVDGKMISKAPWSAYGFGWDSGSDIHLTADHAGVRNFISSALCLVRSSKPIKPLTYSQSALGNSRGRSALAILNDKLILYCTGDGAADVKTPEALRDDLCAMGCSAALMLDGGGSSQCNFAGKIIAGSRKVQNLVLVYLKKNAPEKEPPMTDSSDYIQYPIRNNPTVSKPVSCKKQKRCSTPPLPPEQRQKHLQTT